MYFSSILFRTLLFSKGITCQRQRIGIWNISTAVAALLSNAFISFVGGSLDWRGNLLRGGGRMVPMWRETLSVYLILQPLPQDYDVVPWECLDLSTTYVVYGRRSVATSNTMESSCRVLFCFLWGLFFFLINKLGRIEQNWSFQMDYRIFFKSLSFQVWHWSILL